MNCKPGDLAFIVESRTEKGRVNIGKVVRCECLMTGPVSGVPCWLTSPRMFDAKGDLCVIADSHLRPIRPDGLTDEHVRELYSPEVIVRDIDRQREAA